MARESVFAIRHTVPPRLPIRYNLKPEALRGRAFAASGPCLADKLLKETALNMPTSLVPHAVCWAAEPRLIWTMVVANLVIFASYASICGALLYVVRKTFRSMARDWIWFVVGFALFIVACGSTHLLDVITTWIPVFWIDAWTTIVTAVLSALVAVLLLLRTPTISFAINDYARRLSNSEEEKQSMRDKLVEARKLEDWSRMSAVISHEIANPLEAIQNSLYLIRTDATDASETVRLAREAEEELGRVITISRATLAFHRESVLPERVDLRAVAESVRFLLQGIIRERGLSFEITGEVAFNVEAYPGETRQVILNLARNACEASSDYGTVCLEFSTVDDGVELRVTDEGPGVDSSIIGSLFEFGRSTKGESGNGLGLWTVKQILKKHGGWIALDTQFKAGARFIAWWPKVCAFPEAGNRVNGGAEMLQV